MTDATHYLFTLAECHHNQHQSGCPAYIREAMKAAIGLVSATPDQLCILCNNQLEGTPSYLSLVLPHEPGWQPVYGGLCIECGTTHERAWLQAQVQARAHFAFGLPMGTA